MSPISPIISREEATNSEYLGAGTISSGQVLGEGVLLGILERRGRDGPGAGVEAKGGRWVKWCGFPLKKCWESLTIKKHMVMCCIIEMHLYFDRPRLHFCDSLGDHKQATQQMKHWLAGFWWVHTTTANWDHHTVHHPDWHWWWSHATPTFSDGTGLGWDVFPASKPWWFYGSWDFTMAISSTR